MSDAWAGIISVAIAIVGVAVVAVLVSNRSQTPAVIKSLSQGFAGALSAATAPVTGYQPIFN